MAQRDEASVVQLVRGWSGVLQSIGQHCGCLYPRLAVFAAALSSAAGNLALAGALKVRTAFLLADLGVTKTHSRPYTSADNPFSEAHFKTLKYRPDVPDRFPSLEAARVWARQFFTWYNEVHRHSGIGYLTPASVHAGQASAVHADRTQVLAGAYAAHPERFVRGTPLPPTVPNAAWINPPSPPEVLTSS